MSKGENKLERNVRKVKDNEQIAEADREALLDFKDYDSGMNAVTTAANHLRVLRSTAERADTPLVEMDTDDVLRLLRRFKAGTHPDVDDDGIIVKNFVSSCRVFYRWLNADVDPDSIEIEEDYSGRELSPDELLYKDDVDRILEAAQRESVRDMAAIALMLATGQRLDAVRTLRLKHIETDGPTMQVRLNEKEGALKGASGTKPLLWAKHYVRPWYESHPHSGNPDAALFPPEESGNNLFDSERYGTEPLSSPQFRRTVKKRATRANIDKSVYPHLFRHSAITRMVAEGLSEQQIKNIAGWHGDSSQFETYVTLADDISNDSVRETLGLPTSDSGPPVIGRPSLDTCPSCNDKLPNGRERCPTCQTALTTKEAAEGEPDRKPDVDDITRSVQDMDAMETLRVIEALQGRLNEIQEYAQENMMTDSLDGMEPDEAYPDVDVVEALRETSEEQQRD